MLKNTLTLSFSWKWNEDMTTGQAGFEVRQSAHNVSIPIEYHRCGSAKMMTYDEREYEWLRAFLDVVTWMEGHLEQGEISDTTI